MSVSMFVFILRPHLSVVEYWNRVIQNKSIAFHLVTCIHIGQMAPNYDFLKQWIGPDWPTKCTLVDILPEALTSSSGNNIGQSWRITKNEFMSRCFIAI